MVRLVRSAVDLAGLRVDRLEGQLDATGIIRA